LWIWGSNSGQIGDNTVVNRSSPVQTVSGGTNWKQVSVGCFFTSAIKTDGTLWMWGSNNYGQMGDNTVVSRSSPVQTVSGGTNWKQVATTSNALHLAAVKTDGTLWTWGRNEQGQSGDLSIIDRSSPVQTVSGGTNWKCISVGSQGTAAIKTDGTLWLWGGNTCVTALDLSGIVNSSSPVQLSSGGTNWKEVSLATCHVMAIKEEGDW
jgi:alpha-tubulin suppressor-like RCC1 family protein